MAKRKYTQLYEEGWLYQKYWIDVLTCQEIANIVDCSRGGVEYAMDYLKIRRRNRSELTRGKNNPNYGKHCSKETKKKISEANSNPSEEKRRKIAEANSKRIISEKTHQKLSLARQGKNNPFYGKHHTKKTKDKLSEIHKNPSEDIRKKIREARKQQKFPNHHTKPERIFMDICKKYNLHFKYVGDGSLWIGKDKILNPDFIQADGQKIIVEIFGDYWHSLLLNPRLREDATLNYRKRHYKRYGWKSYFLWGSDLKRSDAEQFVLHTLGMKND